jgi:hypothetical protein
MIIQLQDTRTGSTFFYRCLDFHPEITAYPEVFRISPRRLDPSILNKNDKTTCKIMYNHVKHFNLFGILQGMKIIHVIRRTYYKKALSDVVSNIKSEGLEKKYYDPQRFLHYVVEYKNYVDQFRQLKNSTEHYIEFFMEDFIMPDSTMRQSEADRLCDFLNISRMPLKSDSKKLTPDKSHWDYFENAEEIKNVIGV